MRFASEITRFLSLSKFTKSVITILSGTVLGQAVIVLCSPILTRLYSPEDFGVFAVYSSFLGITAVVGSMRYELAIPLPEDDTAAVNVLILSLLISGVVSCLSGLAVWSIGDRIVIWTKTPTLKPYLWLLPIGILGASSYKVFNYWAIRKKNYTRIGHTKVSQGVMLSLTQISLGVFDIRPLGLLLGQLVGHTAGIGTLASSAWRDSKDHFKKVSIFGILKISNRYRRFPLVSSFSSVLDSLGAQAPILLFAIIYGPVITGWFSLCQRVIGVPLALLGKSVAQVYLGEASRLKVADSEALRKLYLDTAKKLLLMGSVFIVPFGVLAPSLFKIVFGVEWLEAGRYSQIMAPMLLTQFVVSPLSPILNVLERQELHLLWVFAWFVSIVGGLGLANFLNLSATSAVLICSVAMTASYGFHFGLCMHALKNSSRLSIHDQKA